MTTYDPDHTHVDHTHQPATTQPATSQPVNVNAAGTVSTDSPLAGVRRVVGLLFGVLIVLIALRVVLLALGANAGNGLVDAIYAITDPFVSPFRTVFSIQQIQPTGVSVIDIGALVAIVGYSLLAILVIAILRLPDREP
jgi:hypothetical protein